MYPIFYVLKGHCIHEYIALYKAYTGSEDFPAVENLMDRNAETEMETRFMYRAYV